MQAGIKALPAIYDREYPIPFIFYENQVHYQNWACQKSMIYAWSKPLDAMSHDVLGCIVHLFVSSPCVAAT